MEGLSENMRALDEEGENEKKDRFSGNHFSNLHDENWDQSGERMDLATAQPYSNHVDELPADQDLTETEPGDRDALPPLGAEEGDVRADAWLRENDPEYGKN